MTICWQLGRATVRHILRENRQVRNRKYRTI
ncbi:MAG: hypothetical protein GWP16_00575 [Nitrospirae bacterium]|nr:hypothetical protein [Nitrospirota bacterium]